MFALNRDEEWSTWPIRSSTELEVRRIEKEVGVSFPTAYGEFLQATNGGSFLECVLPESPLGPLVVVCYLAVHGNPNYSLAQAILGMRELLVPQAVPFAVDPGGNYFYLDIRRGGQVYFWDHESRDAVLVSPGFEDFLSRLTADD